VTPNIDISRPDLSYSRAESVPLAGIFVRRSVRLSGVDQQPFTPKPDQDEVYGASLLVLFLKLTVH
jgi:hypothetical protein